MEKEWGTCIQNLAGRTELRSLRIDRYNILRRGRMYKEKPISHNLMNPLLTLTSLTNLELNGFFTNTNTIRFNDISTNKK